MEAENVVDLVPGYQRRVPLHEKTATKGGIVEQHIIDAIRILEQARKRTIEAEIYEYPYDARTKGFRARGILSRAVRYLANPDRFIRPKRGPRAVKTGKSRNPRRHLEGKSCVTK